jgi:RNA polymerase sigma factor (sigma-70 family)
VNSDNYLMLQVKKGHTEKLGILFERYKNPLFNYFYRNTGGYISSEDMVQTVFWRILKYRNTFNEGGSFSTWMYQISHRILIDSWRKKKDNPVVGTVADTDISELPSAEEDILKSESLKILSKAIAYLDPAEREILIMSKYQDLKYKDIGQILGCSEGAVKVRIFRALQALKTIYKNLEGQ